MKRNLHNIIISVVFIAFAFWILAVKNGFMLRWYDEMSLFEPGAYSMHQFLLYPGGIFRFAGTFLTQLLFYPALGAGVLILIWLLCAWLTKVSFRLADSTAPLSFLLPLCMLASILQFDEACLSFESQGYVFYNSLGFTFSLAAYCLYAACHRNLYMQAIIVILLPLFYPIAGFFALLPAILCIINLCININKDKKILPISASAISLILVITIPRLYFRFVSGTTVDNDYLYLKGLPELTMESFDWYLWQPFAIATIFLILLCTLSSFPAIRNINDSNIAKWSAIVLFLTGIVLCLKADNRKSEQLRATVLMLDAIEQRDWRKVMHIMSLTKESPNYTMCVLDNLARAYCGQGRSSLANMTTEYKDFRHDEDFTITAFVEVPVNHHIGRFNQSHRWATEHNVQYGSKAYFIKYIIRNAIMNGDMQLARKFNRLLMHTMFHRKWAEDMEKYIANPELIKTMPDFDFLMSLRAEEIMRGE